jgi:hypothetical protein
MGRNAKKGLIDMNEYRDLCDGVGREVCHLQPVVMKKPSENAPEGKPNPFSKNDLKATVSVRSFEGNSSSKQLFQPDMHFG